MDFKDRRPWLVIFLVAVAIGCVLAMSGGGAAKARKVIERGADEFTGNRALRSGNQIKSQLRDLTASRTRRIQEAQSR